MPEQSVYYTVRGTPYLIIKYGKVNKNSKV